ncbi:MAG: phosphate/phosphite/phosphonate ABC transporter substrate-binding protein, partial [Thermodesulfobacteriota bacterium]
ARRMAVQLFLVLLLGGLVTVPAAPAQEKSQQVLKFAVFPYKSPKNVVEAFGPVAARLEKRLGKKVQLVSAPDAATFLTRGLAREYDLALPAVTVYYKMLPVGYSVVAKGVPNFWGGMIVRQDSPITSIDQCRGKKIAAIGEHSYAGYMFFKDLLTARKIDPSREVEILFLGKLDSILYGVLNRQYDAGLIRLDALETKDFAPIRKQFRVVARSAEIPQFPFVVRSDMEPRAVAVIREELTALSPERPADLAILKSLQINGVVAATAADYEPFYQVIKDSEYLRRH